MYLGDVVRCVCQRPGDPRIPSSAGAAHGPLGIAKLLITKCLPSRHRPTSPPWTRADHSRSAPPRSSNICKIFAKSRVMREVGPIKNQFWFLFAPRESLLLGCVATTLTLDFFLAPR
jgi:hypothetical protein